MNNKLNSTALQICKESLKSPNKKTNPEYQREYQREYRKRQKMEHEKKFSPLLLEQKQLLSNDLIHNTSTSERSNYSNSKSNDIILNTLNKYKRIENENHNSSDNVNH